MSGPLLCRRSFTWGRVSAVPRLKLGVVAKVVTRRALFRAMLPVPGVLTRPKKPCMDATSGSPPMPLT